MAQRMYQSAAAKAKHQSAAGRLIHQGFEHHLHVGVFGDMRGTDVELTLLIVIAKRQHPQAIAFEYQHWPVGILALVNQLIVGQFIAVPGKKALLYRPQHSVKSALYAKGFRGLHFMTNQILLACFYLAAFYFIQRNLKYMVQRLADKKQVSAARTSMVTRFLTSVLFFITLSLMAVSLGLGYHDVALFVSSAFAVLGVALVAQWSILSNLTAGVLIFFVFPYRIGDRIKVVDKDEDIRGIIEEIALFHVLIKRDDGNLITYPNSQILQKSVIKLLNPEAYEPKSQVLPQVDEKKTESAPAATTANAASNTASGTPVPPSVPPSAS